MALLLLRETVPENFDLCWHCGGNRDGTPAQNFRVEPDHPSMPDPELESAGVESESASSRAFVAVDRSGSLTRLPNLRTVRLAHSRSLLDDLDRALCRCQRHSARSLRGRDLHGNTDYLTLRCDPSNMHRFIVGTLVFPDRQAASAQMLASLRCRRNYSLLHGVANNNVRARVSLVEPPNTA